SSRRRHTRSKRDWSSDVCSSDLPSPGYSRNRSRQRTCRQARESMAESSTILLVDDEEAVRKVLTFPLERDGYNVVQAADGEEARSEERRVGKEGGGGGWGEVEV